nr:hypothetical protein Iba_chr10eCG1460 [Ipomoea batatas]
MCGRVRSNSLGMGSFARSGYRIVIVIIGVVLKPRQIDWKYGDYTCFISSILNSRVEDEETPLLAGGTHRQCGISLLTPAVTRWITCRSVTQSTNCFWRMKEKTHEMDVIMCIVWDGTLQSLIFHVPDLSNS